jgi:protein-tyrosine-phosphatase
MIKVIFIDKSNTVLSAMCDVVLKEKLLDTDLDVKVYSAGLQTTDGLAMNTVALKALWLRGYDGDDFTSSSLNVDELQNFDYVIIMSKQLKFALPKAKNIFTYGELVDYNELKEPSIDEFITFLDVTSDIENMSDLLIEKFKQN